MNSPSSASFTTANAYIADVTAPEGRAKAFGMIGAAFGLGFAGIIPSYAVAIRDLYPSSEASWRIPLTLFTAMSDDEQGRVIAALRAVVW